MIVIETSGEFTILRYDSDRELLCQDYILIMKYKQGSFVYNKGMIFLNCDLQFFKQTNKKKPSGSRNEDGKIKFIFVYWKGWVEWYNYYVISNVNIFKIL